MWRRWGTPQFFFWHLLMNLKNILIRETVEVGQNENKIILIFTVLHFLKEIKKSTWIYHYFTPVYKKSCYMHVLPCLCTPLPLMNPKNKILKNLKKWRKKKWRYYPFPHVHHKKRSYNTWFLKYKAQWTEFFVILDHFLSFYPLP